MEKKQGFALQACAPVPRRRGKRRPVVRRIAALRFLGKARGATILPDGA
jgi:hypothetical protein